MELRLAQAAGAALPARPLSGTGPTRIRTVPASEAGARSPRPLPGPAGPPRCPSPPPGEGPGAARGRLDLGPARLGRPARHRLGPATPGDRGPPGHLQHTGLPL